MMLVSDIQSFLTVKGHRHGPGELPVTRAKALAELSQVLLIQRADAHTDGGGTRRVAPVQHEDAPIPAHGHIVGVGKAASVVPIVHDPDGLDVLQRDAWHSDLRAHFLPLPDLPPPGGKGKNPAHPLWVARFTPPNWRHQRCATPPPNWRGNCR